MKNLQFFAFALLCMLMASCDSSKDKVKEAALQFVSAVSSNDKVAVNDLYPNARVYPVLKLVDTIPSEDIEVEYVEADSVYVAQLNANQSLVFRFAGEDSLTIVDSYNVMKLDSTAYELAAMTSAPVKKQSDMTNGEMFSDGSDFIQFLAESKPNALNGNLAFYGGRYSWTGGWSPSVTIESPIQNIGERAVEGKDYTIEFSFCTQDTGEHVGTDVSNGWDLAAGETQVIYLYKNNLYYYAKDRNLNWTVTFKFKNATNSTMLAKYGSFTGNEYGEFLKEQAKSKKQAQKQAKK